jgi:hypothetical protein
MPATADEMGADYALFYSNTTVSTFQSETAESDRCTYHDTVASKHVFGYPQQAQRPKIGAVGKIYLWSPNTLEYIKIHRIYHT